VIYLLIVPAALFVGIYLYNGLIRSRSQFPTISFTDMLLAALVVASMIGALAWDNLNEGRYDTEEALLALIALVMLGGSVYVMTRERRRKLKAHQSRGLLGVGVGLSLLLLTFATPAVRVSMDLDGSSENAESAQAAPEATESTTERARGIFDTVLEIVAEQTDLETDTIATNLDEGITVAQMVREHGGDLNSVTRQISDLLTAQIERLVAEERMDNMQAALVISQMDVIVRLGVEQDLTGALARFEDPEGATPQAETPR
jgi:hypothetical protein